MKHLRNPQDLLMRIVCLLTSLGAGSGMYYDQAVRYVKSNVDVYSAPCRFSMKITKNYWSYRKNNHIFEILIKFYLRKVTSCFTCRAKYFNLKFGMYTDDNHKSLYVKFQINTCCIYWDKAENQSCTSISISCWESIS